MILQQNAEDSPLGLVDAPFASQGGPLVLFSPEFDD